MPEEDQDNSPTFSRLSIERFSYSYDAEGNNLGRLEIICLDDTGTEYISTISLPTDIFQELHSNLSDVICEAYDEFRMRLVLHGTVLADFPVDRTVTNSNVIDNVSYAYSTLTTEATSSIVDMLGSITPGDCTVVGGNYGGYNTSGGAGDIGWYGGLSTRNSAKVKYPDMECYECGEQIDEPENLENFLGPEETKSYIDFCKQEGTKPQLYCCKCFHIISQDSTMYNAYHQMMVQARAYHHRLKKLNDKETELQKREEELDKELQKN